MIAVSPTGQPPLRSARLYVTLPPQQVGLFRFLLEAHGHLALFTVVDKYAAVLRLSYSPGAHREVLAFLDQARELIPVRATAPFHAPSPGEKATS